MPTPADLHTMTPADEARAAATATAIRIAQAHEAAYARDPHRLPIAREVLALPQIVSASIAGAGPGSDPLPSISSSAAEPGGSEPSVQEGGHDEGGVSARGAATDVAASGGCRARVVPEWQPDGQQTNSAGAQAGAS